MPPRRGHRWESGGKACPAPSRGSIWAQVGCVPTKAEESQVSGSQHQIPNLSTRVSCARHGTLRGWGVAWRVPGSSRPWALAQPRLHILNQGTRSPAPCGGSPVRCWPGGPPRQLPLSPGGGLVSSFLGAEGSGLPALGCPLTLPGALPSYLWSSCKQQGHVPRPHHMRGHSCLAQGSHTPGPAGSTSPAGHSALHASSRGPHRPAP